MAFVALQLTNGYIFCLFVCFKSFTFFKCIPTSECAPWFYDSTQNISVSPHQRKSVPLSPIFPHLRLLKDSRLSCVTAWSRDKYSCQHNYLSTIYSPASGWNNQLPMDNFRHVMLQTALFFSLRRTRGAVGTTHRRISGTWSLSLKICPKKKRKSMSVFKESLTLVPLAASQSSGTVITQLAAHREKKKKPRQTVDFNI